MATRKKHQLDINLSQVADAPTRSALESIINQVNALSQNISVSNTVKCESLAVHSGLFSADKKGIVRCDMISFSGEKPFRSKVFSGSLAALATVQLKVSDGLRVISAIGRTSVGSIDGREHVMGTESVATGCYFLQSYVDNKSVIVKNGDNEDNYYRVMVFFSEE